MDFLPRDILLLFLSIEYTKFVYYIAGHPVYYLHQ